MPSEINYCDKCGSLIPPSAIEHGSAVVNPDTMLCAKCLKELPPGEREALSAPHTAAPARVKPGRRRPRESESQRAAAAPAGGSKIVTAVAVGIGAAVVSALLGMSLLGGGGSGTPDDPRPIPAVADPTGPIPAPSPPGAAHQLARIRAMIDAGESRYSEARGMLAQFPKSFAGAPEVEDAKALLAEIDAEYAKWAEDELVSAVKAANVEADLDTAVAQIKSVGDRFRAGPWYAQTGQARIAEAIDRLKKGREGLASAATGSDAASPGGTGSSSAAPVGVGTRPGAGTPPAPVDRPPGVYEPFDSQRSDSARGFDGPWQGGMGFAEDSMPWGPLPVKGNRGVSVRDTRPWHTSSYRRIARHALKDAGILKDGTTLWLSAVVPLSDYSLALGSTPFYYTRDSDFFRSRMNLRDGGQGIGFSSAKGMMQSTVWVDGHRRLEGGVKHGSKKDGTALVVLKVAWGSDGNPDRVQLFMPNEELQLGEVVSEISADIDQESLECISYSGGVGTPIDEIRIGASYEDVMGNAAEVKAAADARKKAAAEAEAKAKTEAVLAEFDRLMAERQYEAAQKHVESKMSEDGAKGEELRTAARIARILAELPAAAAKGAKILVGQQQPLKLVTGTVNVTIRAVSKEGLDVTREFTINNQTQTKRSTLKWRELHPSQQAEFARLGGLRIGEAEAHIVAAYLFLAAGDVAGARESVEKAGDHPLKAHVSAVIGKRGK